MQTLVVQNDPICPLGGLAPALQAAGSVATWRPGRAGEPRALDQYDAVVALGGGQAPDDDARFPWLRIERALLAEAIDRGLAVLGICLGAQLIAQVLGAAVGPLSAPDVGWRRLETTPAAARDPVLVGLTDARVFQWHSHGFALPPHAGLLAGTEGRADAFRYGQRVWALQFHGEVDEDLVAAWIEHYGPALPRMGVDPAALRRETARHADAQARTAALIAETFVGAGMH
jgi:GMP synthase (glutamine-hydrolysing)